MIPSRLIFLALAVIPAAIAQSPGLDPEPVPPILATSGDECAEYARLAADYRRRLEEVSKACYADAREAGTRGGYTPALGENTACCLEYGYGSSGGFLCKPLAVCSKQFDQGFCYAIEAKRATAECWERVRRYQEILKATGRSDQESKNQQAMDRVAETAGQAAEILLEPRNAVSSAVTKTSLNVVGAVAADALDQLDAAMLSAGMAPGAPPERTPGENAVSEAASLLLQMAGEWTSSSRNEAGFVSQEQKRISGDELLEEDSSTFDYGTDRSIREYRLEYLGNRLFQRIRIADVHIDAAGIRWDSLARGDGENYNWGTLELADNGDIIVRLRWYVNFPDNVYRWPKGGGAPVMIECGTCPPGSTW